MRAAWWRYRKIWSDNYFKQIVKDPFVEVAPQFDKPSLQQSSKYPSWIASQIDEMK